MANPASTTPTRSGTALRLLCFPFAGGSGATFHPWKDRFGTVVVTPVTLPGRESRFREMPLVDLHRLVNSLCRDHHSLFDGPFALLGHSMGALIAFEVARHLRRLSRPLPAHLIVSGHRAPHLLDSDPPVHSLPDDELLTHLRLMGGDVSVIDEDREAKELLLPRIRADLQLCESYRYRDEPPLDCPITALGGSDDRFVTVAELAGWNFHTSRQFRLRLLPGGHFFLNTAEREYLGEVASCLKDGARVSIRRSGTP